jgi:hypothetical protein
VLGSMGHISGTHDSPLALAWSLVFLASVTSTRLDDDDDTTAAWCREHENVFSKVFQNLRRVASDFSLHSFPATECD